MTEHALLEFLESCGVPRHFASVLSNAAYDQDPPRALIPPEIMQLDAAISIGQCIGYADIIESFFDTEHWHEDLNDDHGLSHVDMMSRKVIACPLCHEFTHFENNTEVGLFIMAHTAFHKFEMNGAIVQTWDNDGNGETGEAGGKYGE